MLLSQLTGSPSICALRLCPNFYATKFFSKVGRRAVYFDQLTHACARVRMVENDEKHSKMSKKVPFSSCTREAHVRLTKKNEKKNLLVSDWERHPNAGCSFGILSKNNKKQQKFAWWKFGYDPVPVGTICMEVEIMLNAAMKLHQSKLIIVRRMFTTNYSCCYNSLKSLLLDTYPCMFT